MGESRTATVCAAASPREVLGYESHGGEATRNGRRWKRKRCGSIHPRMGKKIGDFEEE